VSDCKDLLDWFRVAVTRAAADDTDATSHITRSTTAPDIPIMSPAFVEKQTTLFMGDLPQWNRPTANSAPATPATEAATTTLLQQQLITALLANQSPGAPMSSPAASGTPSSLWKATMPQLLSSPQLSTVAQSPAYWVDVAKANKSERRAVLQGHCDRMATALSYTRPVATARLSKMTLKLSFASSFEDDLEQGLQPFVVSYNSQESIAHAQRMNNISDIILGGGAAPSLTDVFALDTASKISIPTNESQIQRTIEAFTVLLAVLRGVQDPLFLAYNDEIVRAYKTNVEHIEACVKALPALPICSMITVIPSILDGRLERAHGSTQLQGALLADPLQELDPTLYPSSVGSAMPSSAPAGGHVITSPAPQAAPATGVPGALNTTRTGPASEGAQNPIEWNPAADVRIKAKFPLMGTLKNFLLQAGGGQEPAVVPKHVDSLDMCLAFQCKGSCYTTCRRRVAHKKLKATEATRLLNFVEAGLARGEKAGRARLWIPTRLEKQRAKIPKPPHRPPSTDISDKSTPGGVVNELGTYVELWLQSI
jgi:hypothetical protein